MEEKEEMEEEMEEKEEVEEMEEESKRKGDGDCGEKDFPRGSEVTERQEALW